MNETNDVIAAAKNRLGKKNKNWLCAIIGETGSGKSYIAMRLAEAIQDDFPKDASHIYFSAKSMVKDIMDEKIKKGDVAILDESGVAFAARSWYSAENKNFGFLLQVIRHRNFAIIFCLPSLSFMDKMGRILIHTVIETKRIDYLRGVSYASWQRSYFNEHAGKIFKIFPRVTYPDGVVRRVEEMCFRRPSPELLEAYETKKREFTRHQTEIALRQIERNDSKMEDTSKDVNLKDIEAYFNSGFSDGDVIKETGLNRKTILRYRREYNKKNKGSEKYESSTVS